MTDIQNAPSGVDDAALLDEVLKADIATGDDGEKTIEALPEANVQTEQKPVETQDDNRHERGILNELKAERERRQQTEREFGELRAQFGAMQQHFMQMQQPQQQAAPPPDIFENPAAYVQAQVNPALEMQRQAMIYNARLTAEARFGEDKVTAAQTAFDDLLSKRQIDPTEYQKVMNSPNPFAEAVRWHQRHQTISEVGTDPAAYRERVLAEAMKDPAFRQKAMDAWRSEAGNTGAPQQKAQVFNIPSLSKVGSTGVNPGQSGQPSDSEILSSVLSMKRR